MRAVDFRNFTWAQVREHIGDDMRRVHEAWRAHGPGTTRQVAERSGISLLTLRPRTTDLYHLGMVEITGWDGSAGVYQHVSETAASVAQKWKQEPRPQQVQEPRATAGVARIPAAAAPGVPTRSEISQAASILARARGTRRRPSPNRTLLQPELFSV